SSRPLSALPPTAALRRCAAPPARARRPRLGQVVEAPARSGPRPPGPQGGMRTPAEIVDAAAPARVLVFGSLPGSGRDLDLLVRDADLPPIEHALAREGVRNRGDAWVRFRACTADAAALGPAPTW